MPLSARDAFKCGFLSRCIEDGLTPLEIINNIKTANDLMSKQSGIISSLIDTAKDIGGTALHYTIPAAIVAPPILGGAAGYGLAKATDINDQDVSDIKNKEVIDEYNRQTEKLKRRKAVQDFLKSRQQTGRRLI